jgi:hypothetical protein
MTYFSINSTVIYTYMLDITDLLWEVGWPPMRSSYWHISCYNTCTCKALNRVLHVLLFCKHCILILFASQPTSCKTPFYLSVKSLYQHTMFLNRNRQMNSYTFSSTEFTFLSWGKKVMSTFLFMSVCVHMRLCVFSPSYFWTNSRIHTISSTNVLLLGATSRTYC